MHSLRPDKALHLPSAGGGFVGQRRLTSLPSPGGSCRLIARSIRERIAESIILMVSRSNMKLSGQGSPTDLNFPFADNTLGIR